MTFEQLEIGTTFEFYSRRFDLKARRGPWVKVGERDYRHAVLDTLHEIGTPSARVDVIPAAPRAADRLPPASS